MSRLGGWFRSAAKPDPSTILTTNDSDHPSTTTTTSTSTSSSPSPSPASAWHRHLAQERRDIADATSSTQLIMNDDLDGAWAALQTGDSSFHELGSAVTFFMRSVLGFEKGVMTETNGKLAQCETRAGDNLRKVQKLAAAGSGGPGPEGSSKVYPVGAEFDLVRAQAQLMGAVVGVLHESIVEAMKSFYKLRKAYITLDGIVATEDKAVAAAAAKQKAGERPSTARSEGTVKPQSIGNLTLEEADFTSQNLSTEPDSGESSDFVDAKETQSGTQTPLDPPATVFTAPDVNDEKNDSKSDEEPPEYSVIPGQKVEESLGLDTDNEIDVFIHSGSNMSFGVLLLLLTILPPAFSRILSIVGFHGDRTRGINMLWQSTVYPNVYGAVAGMVLLMYYNGLLGAVDILPHENDYDEAAETVGPPKEKRNRLLAQMCARYPDSQLWKVEEARQLSAERKLQQALDVLRTSKESKMKQIRALNNFDLAINSMFAQDWPSTRDAFLRCVEINDWSPAMYYYNAGCASLELYRDAHHGTGSAKGPDETEARLHKRKAEEMLRKAPTLAGKKKFMAKQLPFETFLQRKVARWEERAKELGVDLADAVGPSPMMEMSFMWNGSKRMNTEELESGIEVLSWGRCTASDKAVEKMKADKGEMAVWAIGTEALVRMLGWYDEARAMLEEHVLKQDASTFKGTGKDDYVVPVATYEMAVLAWEECCHPPTTLEDGGEGEVLAYRKRKAEESQAYLDKVRAWEAYLLDARIGMRVQSGLETLKWFRGKMGWV